MRYLDTLTQRGIRASIRQGNMIWLDPHYLVTPDIAEAVRSHKDEILNDIRAISADTSSELPEIIPDYQFLMVATDLDSWEADDPRFGYEIGGEPVYRMLDASYYAWLRHRMENARKAHESGSLDDAAFNTLRERFNAIHTWAVARIGEDALRTAIRTTNVKSYIPPSEQTFAAYRKTWDDAWDAYERRRAVPAHPVAPSDQAGKLQHLLDTQGYAGIRSGIIDDIVVFVRDDSVVVPPKWSGKVIFTMDELTLMIGSSPEAVTQIHEVKRVFGGKVVPTDESDSKLFIEQKRNIMPPSAPQLALGCGV
ncbi:MAG: hypothetical protein M1133_03205 [Armatimonadetes bacterium]|nr:hypothetical protein [Armatimonadota bacterium]